MASRSEIRILIVDDDPTIVRLLTAVLTADGFPAPTAVATGGDALDAIDGVDVVLLDHNLPDMQGTEVLEYLNRHAQPPSVVFITAHGDESVAATALRHGAEDYLVKDASLVKLVPQVVERVRRTRALRESLAAAERNLMLIERRAALGEMSVTLRHEINNPLMSAMAEVELLLDDVGDAAFEGGRSQWHVHGAVGIQFDLSARPSGAIDHFAQQGIEVGRHDGFGLLAAGEFEIALEHFFHFHDVGLELRRLRRIL